jgi:hypothetical protein
LSSASDQPPSGSEESRQGGSPPPGESERSAGERIQVIIEAAEKAAAGIIEDADAQARRYIDASRRRADDLADERVRVMSDLTETLIRQAELVRQQSDELLTALDKARNELATRIGQELSAAQPAGRIESSALSGQPAEGGQGERIPHLHAVESDRPGLQAVDQPAAAEQPLEAAPGPEAESAQGPPQQPDPAVPPTPPQSVPPPSSASSGTRPSDGARLLAAQMAVAGSSREEIEKRLHDEFGIEDAGPIIDGILGSR